MSPIKKVLAESLRLDALQTEAILDTPAEESFDAIARAAAVACGTPIAMVNFIDADRRWMKAAHGIPRSEGPNDFGICPLVIVARDLVVIEDTHADPRVAAKAIVREAPHARFYAGVPVMAANDQAIGTLCVIDRVPRKLDAAGATILRALAHHVERELLLRRRVADLETLLIEQQRTRDELAVFEAIFKHSSDGIGLIDLSGKYLRQNAAHARLLGYDDAELQGKTPALHLGESAFNVIAEGLKANGSWVGDVKSTSKDGRILDIALTSFTVRDETGAPRYLVGIKRDITERCRTEAALRHAHAEMDLQVERRTAELKRAHEELRSTQAQLHQSQKMDAIGRLAGGIAHEFNNLLTVIIGHGELLQLNPDDVRAAREEIAQILHAGHRAATLTGQLLAFSRTQLLTPKILDLNALVVRADQMFRRIIGERIEVGLELAPGIGRIKADPVQIEQALLNLVNNARDAMPAGGRLTISTAEIVVAGDSDQRTADLPPGRYVTVAVSDTGGGMPPEIQHRIFDPFFTTKEVGKGTGLGLSTVYGIVTQSGGHVRVRTAPGNGATFTIYLPAVDGDALFGFGIPKVAEVTPRGNETILLVEDDEQVRRLVASLLTSSGYRVLSADGGDEALRMTESKTTVVDLLVTDVVMPGLSGPELAQRLKESRPGLHVLYISGYLADPTVLGVERDAALLQKPFSMDRFLRRVRSLLDTAIRGS